MTVEERILTYDVDNSGCLDVNELCSLMSQLRTVKHFLHPEGVMTDAFTGLDSIDNHISEWARDTVTRYSADGDRRLDFDEFILFYNDFERHLRSQNTDNASA